MDPRIGFLVLRSSLDPWKNKFNLVFLLKTSRSWMIFPISGAPGVGQNPSPFESTFVSDLVNMYLDKFTIPLTFCISFSLLNTCSKLWDSLKWQAIHWWHWVKENPHIYCSGLLGQFIFHISWDRAHWVSTVVVRRLSWNGHSVLPGQSSLSW